MAYVSQEMKAKLAPQIKAICKKYGVKGSLAVRHHSTLVLNVKSGNIDFFDSFNRTAGARPRPAHLAFRPAQDHLNVNVYHYESHFDGKAAKFLAEVIPALKGPDYFDDSDPQTDYFHCSHYIDVNIGKWDRPYALEK